MISVARISYSLATDTTKFKLSDAYERAGPLLQADIMKDLLHLVECEYEAAVRRLEEDFDARRKRAQQSGQ